MTKKTKAFIINVSARITDLNHLACVFVRSTNTLKDEERKACPASYTKKKRSSRGLHPHYPQLLLYPVSANTTSRLMHATRQEIFSGSAASAPLRRQQLRRKLHVNENNEANNKINLIGPNKLRGNGILRRPQEHRQLQTQKERVQQYSIFPPTSVFPNPQLGMTTTAAPIRLLWRQHCTGVTAHCSRVRVGSRWR